MISRPNRNRSDQHGTPPRETGAPIDASTGKATGIRLFSVAPPHMRTFHMTWMAFFLAFFGWFGIAPMMAIVRDDLGLTKTQVGNTVIASVLATIAAAPDRWVAVRPHWAAAGVRRPVDRRVHSGHDHRTG